MNIMYEGEIGVKVMKRLIEGPNQALSCSAADLLNRLIGNR